MCIFANRKININSIKCSPWNTTAEVEIEERVLNVKGRYIKIVGRANSVNQWMNLQEVAFTGK